MPKDERGNKTGQPGDDSIEACKPRLEEFIALASPRLIVCVGKLAENWIHHRGFKHNTRIPLGTVTVAMLHPAAILKGNVAARELQVQRCIVTLQNAVEKL